MSRRACSPWVSRYTRLKNWVARGRVHALAVLGEHHRTARRGRLALGGDGGGHLRLPLGSGRGGGRGAAPNQEQGRLEDDQGHHREEHREQVVVHVLHRRLGQAGQERAQETVHDFDEGGEDEEEEDIDGVHRAGQGADKARGGQGRQQVEPVAYPAQGMDGGPGIGEQPGAPPETAQGVRRIDIPGQQEKQDRLETERDDEHELVIRRSQDGEIMHPEQGKENRRGDSWDVGKFAHGLELGSSLGMAWIIFNSPDIIFSSLLFMANRILDRDPRVAKRWPYRILNFLPSGQLWRYSDLEIRR